MGAKNLNYRVKFTQKQKIDSPISDIIQELNLQTPEYLRHVYDTGHQYKSIGDLKTNLDAFDVLIVIDFSQNYYCKSSQEIQGMHFGASKKQISLHTGAFFYKNHNLTIIGCVSFCTVSECLRHDASSIWCNGVKLRECDNLPPRCAK